jgi:virginiamycin B lyase
MYVIFHRCRSTAVSQAKLIAYGATTPEHAAEMAREWEGRQPEPLPFVQYDLGRIPEPKRRTIQYRALRLLRAVQAAYPIAPEEKLAGEGAVCGYLSSGIDGLPNVGPGTVGVWRRTDQAEICFLSPEFQFDGEDIVDLRTSLPSLDEAGLAPLAIEWGALALKIGMAVASPLINRMASKIFEKIFPPEVPSYFQDVYDEVRRIIRQELDENTVRQLQGDIGAVQKFMGDYALNHLPDNHAKAQELLSHAYETSVKVTAKLQQFPLVGLAPFCVAGGLHLAILQERALTDRSHTDPNNSPWARSLVQTAETYSAFAAGEPTRLVDVREAQISQVQYQQEWKHTAFGPIAAHYYWWQDTAIPLFKKYPAAQCCGNPEETARQERAAHHTAVISPLRSYLAAAYKAAATWKKAAETLLPQPRILQVTANAAGDLLALHSAGWVFRRDRTTKRWTSLNRNFADLSIGADGSLWALDAAGRIYRLEGAVWKPVRGTLARISVGSRTLVWGTQDDDRIWRYTGSDEPEPWTQPPSPTDRAVMVAVGSDSAIWCVNRDRLVWKRVQDNWVSVSGTLVAVAVGSAQEVWGVDATGKIYRHTGNADRPWDQITGPALGFIAVTADGSVWGVTLDGKILHRQGVVWNPVTGPLSERLASAA